MEVFTTYSTRSAVVSEVQGCMPVQAIIDSVGWASELTFARYYRKKVVKKQELAEVLLAKNTKK